MYNILQDLKEKRTSYLDMVDFCCGDQIILNNEIVSFMEKNDYYDYEIYCGSDRTYYDENGDETEEETENYDYDDIYQYYIITESAAERFKEYTNELVIYYNDADIYLLCVKHCGTSWDYVPANWKDE